MNAFDKWYDAAMDEGSYHGNTRRLAEAGWYAAREAMKVQVVAMLVAAITGGMLLGYAKAYSVRHEPRTIYFLATNMPPQGDVITWGTFTNRSE